MPEERNTSTQDIFSNLIGINVNDYIEEKNTGKTTLKYLSWSYAWKEVRARYPSATYKIIKNENNLPYFYDHESGIMVYTEVTIENETHEMWLPVMDGANNAMKFVEYEIETRFGPKKVAKATMFDVNKAIMRCLAKNLAMFGLGLYIYSGEDLPFEPEDTKQQMAEMIVEIDTLVKDKVKEMGREEKAKFANEVIIPIIGTPNYKTCKDIDKLIQLRDKINAA